MLPAPAGEGEPVPPRRAVQILGDLDVEDHEPGLELLGLVNLEVGRIAVVAAPEELGHGNVRPALRTVTGSEHVPRGAAHLERVVSGRAILKRAEGPSTP